MEKVVNARLKKAEDNKEKWIVRIYLLLFIIAIFAWIIPSTIGFITLNNGTRAAELPQWLKDTSALIVKDINN